MRFMLLSAILLPSAIFASGLYRCTETNPEAPKQFVIATGEFIDDDHKMHMEALIYEKDHIGLWLRNGKSSVCSPGTGGQTHITHISGYPREQALQIKLFHIPVIPEAPSFFRYVDKNDLDNKDVEFRVMHCAPVKE